MQTICIEETEKDKEAQREQVEVNIIGQESHIYTDTSNKHR
jgi:hypothetical protein